MQKNQLGTSELYVSKLGLGCMSLGTNEIAAKEIVKAAVDVGINYFDTADLYDFGLNEEIVGKSLKPVRDQVIIATKVGNRWNDDKTSWHWDPSKAYIKEAVKNSLHRLQTNYIDLYQLHGGTIQDPIDETIEAFEELKKEGLIRYYGISSIRPNVIREYVQKSNIVSVMIQYSLLDRRPEEDILPLLKEHSVSAVTRGPVAKGILSERSIEKISEKGYLDYSYQELVELMQEIKDKLLLGNRKMTELALQYNLANESVASVITGASNAEQIRENAKAVEKSPLSKEERDLLIKLTKQNKYTDHR
ncbi:MULTISPECIES: aldo/keto reductase [Heyndrickxia]|uniref:aldo/keto reductase n=1 Tax=Heyndrickxia TaxID=2837504 RepID=UPI002E1F8A8B|nr:aldo/keto reductase [Heyndrickxia sporothermodurans]MED3699244.1 aldo/keto reductase [Heyndrickxia sporothermodurans]